MHSPLAGIGLGGAWFHVHCTYLDCCSTWAYRSILAIVDLDSDGTGPDSTKKA